MVAVHCTEYHGARRGLSVDNRFNINYGDYAAFSYKCPVWLQLSSPGVLGRRAGFSLMMMMGGGNWSHWPCVTNSGGGAGQGGVNDNPLQCNDDGFLVLLRRSVIRLWDSIFYHFAHCVLSCSRGHQEQKPFKWFISAIIPLKRAPKENYSRESPSFLNIMLKN